MAISRRIVLTGGLAGTLSAILPVPGIRNLAFAENGTVRPTLVVVHLRGGCDGLNLVSPANDPSFIEARASDLRVATDGTDAGFALPNGPDPKIDFRLHAQADGLAELYKSGQLAFIHAAGLTDGTRSHFVATDMIERGVSDAANLGRTSTGWLMRALQPSGGAGVQAVSAAGSPSGELAGLAGTLAVPDLGGGL